MEPTADHPLGLDTITLHASMPSMSPSGDNADALMVECYTITSHHELEQVYLSPHCFGHAFKETFQYLGSAILHHSMAGLDLSLHDGLVCILSIHPGTPCTKIPRWKTQLHGACTLG
jgi:hypothetical protein